MPNCFNCGQWYNDPIIDNLDMNDLGVMLDDGRVDPENLDCGDEERHTDIEVETQKWVEYYNSVEEV